MSSKRHSGFTSAYNYPSSQSIVNSTVIPLSGGATFTGAFETNFFTDVGVSLQCDSDCTLFFDFSPDSDNVNTFPVAGFNVVSGIHEFHTAVKLGRYFRVRLVNNATPQTYCRLYTYYGSFRQGNLPVGNTINDDSDCIIVRQPYNDLEIARNNNQNVQSLTQFGDNSSVGVTLSPVASSGFYRMPTTAVTLQVLSSSASDTAAGSGARSVTIVGLDSNWDEVTITVATAGTGTVNLATPLLRVYKFFVATSGTYSDTSTGSHVGTITLRNALTLDVWATITIEDGYAGGISHIGCYTVPNGKSLYIQTISVGSDSDKTTTVYFFQRENADTISAPTTPLRLIKHYEKISGTLVAPFSGTGTIPAKTDIGFLAINSTGNSSVSTVFKGYLFLE